MPDADGMQERRLNDGSVFRVVKLFHEPAELAMALGALGWRASIARTANYFIFGHAQRV